MWISAFAVYEPAVKQPSRQEEEATIDSGRVAECCVPLIYTLLQRLTQATFKLTRWLAGSLASPHLAIASPAPTPHPLRQTLTIQTGHQCLRG